VLIQQTNNLVYRLAFFYYIQIKIFSVSILVLSFLGILDAGYLTVKHYTGAYIPCTILEGCNAVAQSEYSSVMGIPVAFFGLLFYVAVFILTMALLDSKKTWQGLAI